MASQTYQLLLFIKYNWKANIQGLSATPYRKGKSQTRITVDIDCDDIEKIRTQENENKLIQVFHKKGNVNELNILSWFNLKEAIENNIILEPVFHWFTVNNYIKKNKNHIDINKKYSPIETNSVLTVLDEIIEKCIYKKCIVWCRLKDIANKWYEIFKDEKDKYSNLKLIEPFIDHSNLNNEDYEKFYNKKDNALIFCASKFREGSDIPYLTCCLFLDKVKNRGEIPFIQCISRVLRKDKDNLKDHGHIIDGTEENDDDRIKTITNKLLRYYLHLFEIAKSDLEMSDVYVMENKLELYDKIMKSLQLVPAEKRIYIKLDNNKKITLDLENVDIKTMEWRKIIPNFDQVLKNTLILSEYEEYLAFQKKVNSVKIKNVKQYDEKWLEYGFYTIEGNGNKIKIDPRATFGSYFKNWYDFLNINTCNFIKDKKEWKETCSQLGINSENYDEKVKYYDFLPVMPEEFYIPFSSVFVELSYFDDE